MLVTLDETCNQTQFIRLLHTSMVYHRLVTLNKTCNHTLFLISCTLLWFYNTPVMLHETHNLRQFIRLLHASVA